MALRRHCVIGPFLDFDQGRIRRRPDDLCILCVLRGELLLVIEAVRITFNLRARLASHSEDVITAQLTRHAGMIEPAQKLLVRLMPQIFGEEANDLEASGFEREAHVFRRVLATVAISAALPIV